MSASSSVSVPRAMRDISRRSSTSRTIWPVWRSSTSRPQRRFSSRMSMLCRTSSTLRIGASGLRSSCPSMARNSSFLRSASSRAAFAPRRSVTSSMPSMDQLGFALLADEAPRIEQHDALAERLENMLHRVVLDGFVLRERFVEQPAQIRDVPLPVAEVVEQLPLGVAGRDAEQPIEGRVRALHAQPPVEHEQRMAHRVDDRLGEVARLAERFVRVVELLVAGAQLVVGGGELLVGRLQLLLGGFQLFVGALQLLVRRQRLLVQRLQPSWRGSRTTCWSSLVNAFCPRGGQRSRVNGRARRTMSNSSVPRSPRQTASLNSRKRLRGRAHSGVASTIACSCSASGSWSRAVKAAASARPPQAPPGGRARSPAGCAAGRPAW